MDVGFIGRSQRFPTPFRVYLISQQGSEQDGSLLQRISHLMVSTVLIYWNLLGNVRTCVHRTHPWTSGPLRCLSFVPLYRRKQGHHDPKQAIGGGEELAIQPCQGREGWRGREEVLVPSLALPAHAHAAVFLLGVSGR